MKDRGEISTNEAKKRRQEGRKKDYPQPRRRKRGRRDKELKQNKEG